jgi:outer membrane protein OmpA-like peptidoglycan-associated protein
MLIQANPKIIVEISSHTDDIGTAQSNMKLSKQRASEIIHYLVGLGIDKKRLRSKGYGETLPIASNETPEGRSKNRRTEFRVVGKVKERISKRRKDDDD